jgi:aspartyl/asparaginyl beta-hydroxylase (cupin superfamily)
MGTIRQQKGLAALERWLSDSGISRDAVARIFAGLDYDTTRSGSLQRPALLCPGLMAAPWHNPADVPWTRALVAASSEIRAEFLEVNSRLAAHPEADEFAMTGSWSAYYFYNLGQPNRTHLAECPRTAAALAEIDGIDSAGKAYFSVLAPGTRVKPHCGLVNTRIRCHLGLVVPDGCWMRVGDETRAWSEGGCLVFDDSFEHEAANDSDQLRAVLLVDAWHPELTDVERMALIQLMREWHRELR